MDKHKYIFPANNHQFIDKSQKINHRSSTEEHT